VVFFRLTKTKNTTYPFLPEQPSKFPQIHKAIPDAYAIFARMNTGDYFSNPGLEEGDYYLSPEGYKVFTEQYHLKRGYCCKNGCKHCPYGFKKRK
jgi:hypothetical protein